MPRLLLLCVALAFLFPRVSRGLVDPEQNITVILGRLPGFSLFNRLLSSTSVAAEINARSSVTVLAPNDSAVEPLLGGYNGGGIPAQQISDTLRYHVLLEYMNLPDMRARPSAQPVTTLYQTTGRAAGQLGWVSLTPLPSGHVGVGLPFPRAPPNATIIATLALYPYNISVLQVDRVLVPPQLAASPPPPYPQVNITDALVRAGRFGTFVAFLQATQVDQTFQDSESKEGITIFAPVDDAFAELASSTLQKLTAQQKILVLEYHALNAYYALGTLKEFKNPVAPTVATSDPHSGGAGQFTVNVTSVDGVFTIYTGVVAAPVVATVMEDKPVSIFVIEKVLLPKAYFASRDDAGTKPPSRSSSSHLLPPPPLLQLSPPPDVAAPPLYSSPPSELAAPPDVAAPPGLPSTAPSPSPLASSSDKSPLCSGTRMPELLSVFLLFFLSL